MSDMGALPGLLPGGFEPTDPAECVDALLHAINICARKAAVDPSAQEVKDYAAATLSFAQAIVVLDPSLTSDGTPLDHELELEQMRQDGQERMEKARLAAAAPTPRKRTLRKTNSGYEMEG